MTRFSEIHREYQGPPVNIEAIIRALGIQLDKTAHLDEKISGQLEKQTDGGFIMSINGEHSFFRQRFTMAHELAHYLLHSNKLGEGLDDSIAYKSEPAGNFFNTNITQKEENEANVFAASILLPKEIVLRDISLGDSVSEAAKLFQVSRQAMEIRLKSFDFEIDDDVIVKTPIS